MVVFTIASILSGLSQNIQQLIYARMMQGIGGALLVPGSLSIINISFDEKIKGKAIGIWAGLTALTTALGPLIGAWLAEYYSWRLVFFMNIPIALIVLPVLLTKVQFKETLNKNKLDIVGSFLISLGLGLIIYGLIESSNLSFTNPIVISSILLGIIMVSGFIYYENKIENPILPLGIFKSLDFTISNIITFIFWAAWNAAIFFLPLTFIQVFGYRVDQFAVGFIPTYVALIIFAPISGFLVNRLGIKLPLILGNLIIGLSYYLYTLADLDAKYINDFLLPITLMGAGVGLTISPLVSAVFGSAGRSNSGLISGINNSIGRVAGLFAIAMMGVVAINYFNYEFFMSISEFNIEKTLKEVLDNEKINMGAMTIPNWVTPELKSKLETAVRLSFLKSFRIIMYICSCLAFICSILTLFALNQNKILIDDKEINS
ncbi:MAG: MFS transporter [Candidatus Dadabacteria bacterium]|nr:MFS transporter [Candidatus Dadabacteria bacterium]NIQ14023.1 MFS transporter [Candidatus Dadabacteria bacterium]